MRLSYFAAAAAGTFALSAPALAEPILEARCATDQLSIEQARARLEWARACGDRINVISPTMPTLPAEAYDTGLVSANGVSMWEYIETDEFWGKNSYSGQAATVNQMFIQNQFRMGPITATSVAGGFQKWTEPVSLPRPYYPTFGNNSAIAAATQLFPPPALPDGSLPATDCKLYTDARG
ncbi:MAG TPA: hypothetical protein VLM79_40720, partial [Kofleriaceae bacterium]|nr:hypothetical protein [Kofleriaceae bacterium]